MKHPIEAVLNIEDVTHDGKGVGRLDGKAVFVDGAIPGEQAKVEIYKRRKSHDEARAIKILQVSPYRIEPPCEHFGICGGCSWQHIHAAYQIKLKQKILVDNIQRIGHIDHFQLADPIDGHHLGYRRRARLGAKFDKKKSNFYLGFREKYHNRYIAAINCCIILDINLANQLPTIAQTIADLDCFDKVPQVEVAIGDIAIALVFRHLVPLSEHDKALLSALGQEKGWHIFSQSKGPDSVKSLWPLEPPALFYSLPAYDLKLEFEPLDFIQINAEINQKLIARAIDWLELKSTDRVLDLFCGIGNFSLAIARYVESVHGIEGDAGLVDRANKNAILNRVHNATFHVADLAQAVTLPAVDKVLLDPPRTGAIKLIGSVAALGAEKIIYVSCNAATLARDAGMLVHEYGYHLVKASVCDMFPHTSHAETIALFSKTPL